MKILFILLFILNAFSIVAQKKKTYFDKATTIEVTSGTDSINAMLDDYERIQLPPLSVFWNPYMTILLSEFMKLKEMRLTPI